MSKEELNETLKELKLLLKSYDISEEFIDKVETMIKAYIKSELVKRGLPTEDWIINPLFRLFIHIAYITLVKIGEEYYIIPHYDYSGNNEKFILAGNASFRLDGSYKEDC